MVRLPGLATREVHGWVFRGLVGSGFARADLEAVTGRLQKLTREGPAVPLTGVPKGIVWVQPELQGEVTFQEETPRGHFRAPAFTRLIG